MSNSKSKTQAQLYDYVIFVLSSFSLASEELFLCVWIYSFMIIVEHSEHLEK